MNVCPVTASKAEEAALVIMQDFDEISPHELAECMGISNIRAFDLLRRMDLKDVIHKVAFRKFSK